MSSARFVDWGVAERVAVALAQDRDAQGGFAQSDIDSACSEAVALVLDHTRLSPADELPPPELVDRTEWARLGLRTLRELSSELEGRVADGISLPAPLGGIARSLAGAAAGAEAGAAVGYGARKVLGQYDVALVPHAERAPRLVFVGANLASAHAELGEESGLFLRWIAIHETTHSVQFASVPWLRDHLAALLQGLIGAASARLDLGSLGALARRLLRADPRTAVRTVLRGDLPRLLASPEQVNSLDPSRRRCRWSRATPSTSWTRRLPGSIRATAASASASRLAAPAGAALATSSCECWAWS
jgi:putative hydrolase